MAQEAPNSAASSSRVVPVIPLRQQAQDIAAMLGRADAWREVEAVLKAPLADSEAALRTGTESVADPSVPNGGDSGHSAVLSELVDRWRLVASASSLTSQSSALRRCADELDALLVSTRREQQQWQPIDSAPKDGTWIVVTSTHNKYARGAIQWLNGAWVDWSDEPVEIGNLTHWMLLPDPPEATPHE